MGKICKIIAGFEDGGVHQRRQRGMVAALEGLNSDLDVLGLRGQRCGQLLTLRRCTETEGIILKQDIEKRTSPFSN